jgi:hypothetical protein
MNEDLSLLFDRIRTLVNGQTSAVPAPRAEEIEHTLTDGYARALALEGERLRAERRLRALAGDADRATELRVLSTRLHALDTELRELRDLLQVLSATL